MQRRNRADRRTGRAGSAPRVKGASGLVLGVVVALLADCSEPGAGEARDEAAAPAAADPWLHGSVDERLAQVAKHLRGFDVAMVETGYRYGELYWAGQDGNWDYARYQLTKIETAIANGLERRPKRAGSARALEAPVQALHAVIEAHDVARFASAFADLTSTCNSCHLAEQVAFIHVAPPTVRLSPVAAVAPEGTP